uniref:Uncharacterized protein n=1 Tax=Avena sativa TaxID=4498 RepID=A0ACD6A0J7_AVESA
MPPFPPSSASGAREGSQQQLAMVPNNSSHFWNHYLVDTRCQVNEDAERRFQQLASSVHKVEITLDSVQNDAIRLNRAMKEASLDSGSIQKKVDFLESSLQQILKGQNDLKVLHEGNTTHNSDHLGVLNTQSDKLNEISSTISVWPEQVRADIRHVHGDIFRNFTKEMEGVVRAIRSINSKTVAMQMLEDQSCSSNERLQRVANGSSLMNLMPVANERLMMNQTPVANGQPVMNRTPVPNGSPLINWTPVGNGRPQMYRTPGTKGIPQRDRTPVANGRPHMEQIPATKLLPAPFIYSTRTEDPKPNEEVEKVKGSQLVGSSYMLAPKRKEASNQKVNTQEPTKKAPVNIIIDSDGDNEGCISSVILNTAPAGLTKEAGGQDGLQLLRWARKNMNRKETICIDATALLANVTGEGEKRRQKAEPEEEKGESVHVAAAPAKRFRRPNPRYAAAQWAT